MDEGATGVSPARGAHSHSVVAPVVGILKMLINTFEGRPVLLMDEVRVGKTLQVLGYSAMRAYLYEAREQQGGLQTLW